MVLLDDQMHYNRTILEKFIDGILKKMIFYFVVASGNHPYYQYQNLFFDDYQDEITLH